MASQLPVASVFNKDGKSTSTVALPEVFSAPLRSDIIRTVFTGINKNKRQAHGVKYGPGHESIAGYDTAAISWGTGRAVARIPRVPGGGTHRSGQGAFGNMCRGGGMFNPLKTWRKWHRKVNTTQKRHALASAVAATAVAPLVMARGHEVMEVPELPLVISSTESSSVEKTKDALALCKVLGVAAELEKSDKSKKLRAGKGKLRNRRYVMRKGPLVVYSEDESNLTKAFRNIPGVDLCCVDRLNLLQLAPGGTFGRFVIYTEASIKKLGDIFGSYETGSALKSGYTLPRSLMTNTDISKIINSEEIQSVLTPAKEPLARVGVRKNPLKNNKVLARLCPGALVQKKIKTLAHDKNSVVGKKITAKKVKKQEKTKKHTKAKKEFFKNLQEAYNVVEEEEEEEEEAEEEEE